MLMGNIKIKLDSTKKINNVNIYSDVDVTSNYMSNTLYDRAAVKASINNILTWKPYERILNPSFGNGLWLNLFENIRNETKASIIDTVKKMLKSEPRIKVGNISISTNASANELSVSFTYTIPELDDTEELYELKITKTW